MTPPSSSSTPDTPAETSQDKYTAANLLVLEGLEAVRKRPGMYIGSTDSRGLMHCLWEIIDNSVDEALGGHCSSITVHLHADGSVEVHDDGRGIPVDVERRTGLSGVEVVFTHLHAGGKFGGGSYSASGGLHGVGASVVNALSSRLDVEVDRGGKTYATSFRRGAPGRYAGEGPDAPFTPATGLEVTGRAKRGVTGTRVRYWADSQVFLKEAKFAYEDLAARARQTSFLVPGLKIVVRDERSGEAVEEVFQHDGGISEYAEYLTPDAPVTSVWRLQGEDVFTETVPVLDASGHMDMQDVERQCSVDVALRWGTGYEPTIRTFVNIISTPKGGSHLAGFETAVHAAVRDQLAATTNRKLKLAKDEKLEKDDVLAGMTAVVTVRLAEPQFEGQTKEVLGTAAVRGIVRKVVERELTAQLTATRGEGKAQAAAVLDKIVTEMRSRISARLHKETQRRKNALESSSLPPKLKDCRSDDVGNTELFLVEGDSALGTAMGARDSEFQALLPLRGKILNVQKASVTDMLKNAECASIIQVVGGGSGRSFDLDAVRYGKIVLMTDADVDGAHIRTLLLTLFFRYMRPLIDAGRVYAAVPPLHRVEVSGSGRREKEVIYTYSDAELRRVTADLIKRNRPYKDPQRYKGLGEMDEDQLAETTMERAHRTLRRVTVPDGAVAERVFELLMGNDVAPRKDFIIAGAENLDRERIDA